MSHQHESQSMHWLTKSVYLVLIAGCILLGLVGLVLPIIPGLVFLFLAALLATKVSRRAHTLASAHVGFRHVRRRVRTMSLLRATDRLKLGFWYSVGAVIKGTEACVNFVQNRLRTGPSAR